MEKDNQDNSKTKRIFRLQNILGGSFLTTGQTAKHLPFLFFLAFLAILYIGNSYYAEKKVRRIEKLQKEVKELRFEHIYTKSQRVSKSRQSEIAKNLQDEGIKESMVPPKKIEQD